MIHIREDDKTICGLAKLPAGDTFFYAREGHAEHTADCQGCNPGGPKPWGVPLSQLRGRPDGTPEGRAGYERFKQIAASWGYD